MTTRVVYCIIFVGFIPFLSHPCPCRSEHLLLSFERVLLLSTASPPRCRGRCWAAIRLSHRPEPSGRVVRGGVDGLDSGGRRGRRCVLRHNHRPQRRPCPICTDRSGNVRHRCGGGWAGPRLFLGGSFLGCVQGRPGRVVTRVSCYKPHNFLKNGVVRLN